MQPTSAAKRQCEYSMLHVLKKKEKKERQMHVELLSEASIAMTCGASYDAARLAVYGDTIQSQCITIRFLLRIFKAHLSVPTP